MTSTVKEFVTPVVNVVKKVVTPVVNTVKEVVAPLVPVWNAVKTKLSDTWNAIKANAIALWNTTRTKLQNGWNAQAYRQGERAEPFDRFTWDLSAYTQSGQHMLRVEAVDSLGLSKASVEIPVMVTVIRPPTGLRAFLAKYRAWIAGSAVALTGLALILVLLSGRLRIASWRERREARQRYTDPVTQPVLVAAETPGKRRPATGPEEKRANKLRSAGLSHPSASRWRAGRRSSYPLARERNHLRR